jgi:YD repeat-containing protein
MLINYDPMSDVLSITMQGAPATQTQTQGTVSVGFDGAGNVASIAIPNASSVLWENGGQVSVALPPAAPAVVETVVERRML